MYNFTNFTITDYFIEPKNLLVIMKKATISIQNLK